MRVAVGSGLVGFLAARIAAHHRRPTTPGYVDDGNQEGTAYTVRKSIHGQAACVRKASTNHLKVVMLNGSTPGSCSPMVMPVTMTHKPRR